MVCHGMVLENPWDMLTNMLTVDTTTALGQVDMSLCIHALFMQEARDWTELSPFCDQTCDTHADI